MTGFYNVSTGTMASNVQYFGMALVEHKYRLRGGWKRKTLRRRY